LGGCVYRWHDTRPQGNGHMPGYMPGATPKVIQPRITGDYKTRLQNARGKSIQTGASPPTGAHQHHPVAVQGLYPDRLHGRADRCCELSATVFSRPVRLASHRGIPKRTCLYKHAHSNGGKGVHAAAMRAVLGSQKTSARIDFLGRRMIAPQRRACSGIEAATVSYTIRFDSAAVYRLIHVSVYWGRQQRMCFSPREGGDGA